MVHWLFRRLEDVCGLYVIGKWNKENNLTSLLKPSQSVRMSSLQYISAVTVWTPFKNIKPPDGWGVNLAMATEHSSLLNLFTDQNVPIKTNYISLLFTSWMAIKSQREGSDWTNAMYREWEKLERECMWDVLCLCRCVLGVCGFYLTGQEISQQVGSQEIVGNWKSRWICMSFQEKTVTMEIHSRYRGHNTHIVRLCR